MNIPEDIKRLFLSCGGATSSRRFFNVYDDGALISRTTVYVLPLKGGRSLIAAPGVSPSFSWTLWLEARAYGDVADHGPALVELCRKGIDASQVETLCSLLENNLP